MAGAHAAAERAGAPRVLPVSPAAAVRSLRLQTRLRGDGLLAPSVLHPAHRLQRLSTALLDKVIDDLEVAASATAGGGAARGPAHPSSLREAVTLEQEERVAIKALASQRTAVSASPVASTALQLLKPKASRGRVWADAAKRQAASAGATAAGDPLPGSRLRALEYGTANNPVWENGGLVALLRDSLTQERRTRGWSERVGGEATVTHRRSCVSLPRTLVLTTGAAADDPDASAFWSRADVLPAGLLVSIRPTPSASAPASCGPTSPLVRGLSETQLSAAAAALAGSAPDPTHRLYRVSAIIGRAQGPGPSPPTPIPPAAVPSRLRSDPSAISRAASFGGAQRAAAAHPRDPAAAAAAGSEAHSSGHDVIAMLLDRSGHLPTGPDECGSLRWCVVSAHEARAASAGQVLGMGAAAECPAPRESLVQLDGALRERLRVSHPGLGSSMAPALLVLTAVEPASVPVPPTQTVPTDVFGWAFPPVPQPRLPPPPPPSVPALPSRGDVVALDAEFVAVGLEERGRGAGGASVVTLATRLAPARVTVVRSDGTVLIDDWICPAEPVLDHLSRFSGVQPGELDAATSPRRLHSERAVSLKLRALVDAGVVWVGHGLRSDFAVLGMCPPEAHVRDTAALYRGIDGRARKLRLLASTVLGSSIQGDAAGHSSLEDARSALVLFQKREALLAEGGGAWERQLRAIEEAAVGARGQQGAGHHRRRVAPGQAARP